MNIFFRETANAYAKINTGLAVCGKREDGYHLLDTVMQTVSLCDKVTLSVIRYDDPEDVFIPIGLTGSGFMPRDDKNTAYRAASVFLSALNIRKIKIDIIIEKQIPSQAGLGGASADAAAVLLLLNKAFDFPLSRKELLNMGASIGADVPFCLSGGTKRCRGIGEDVQEIPELPALPVLLIKPPVGISTPWAFAQIDSKREGSSANAGLNENALSRLDGSAESFFMISSVLKNDFEEIAKEKYANMTDIRKFLENSGAGYVSMSGSGSCFFGIYKEKDLAGSAKKRAGQVFPPASFFSELCLLQPAPR